MHDWIYIDGYKNARSLFPLKQNPNSPGPCVVPPSPLPTPYFLIFKSLHAQVSVKTAVLLVVKCNY